MPALPGVFQELSWAVHYLDWWLESVGVERNLASTCAWTTTAPPAGLRDGVGSKVQRMVSSLSPLTPPLCRPLRPRFVPAIIQINQQISSPANELYSAATVKTMRKMRLWHTNCKPTLVRPGRLVDQLQSTSGRPETVESNQTKPETGRTKPIRVITVPWSTGEQPFHYHDQLAYRIYHREHHCSHKPLKNHYYMEASVIDTA
ncbi:uncharacterized protein H6S33_005883 [Morchella sextelata]|uniref:uncharacterized protein n=1 Tax=Morchella sextelata TaxID=1174677 RepID=UPI001D039FEA|nr:uncharacterized protein H6S33_005883 [Morchella sextelata]KAH0613997.1 hypothetical protein H6S33_005883 [Morchella sextelata]